MNKPDNMPQDVWDAAEIAAREATRDAMRDPLMPYYITVAPYIARAIIKARQDALEAAIVALQALEGVPPKTALGEVGVGSYNFALDLAVESIRSLSQPQKAEQE